MPLGDGLPLGDAVPVGDAVVGDGVLGAGVLAVVPPDWVGVGLGVPSSEHPARASTAIDSTVAARAVGEVRDMTTSLPSTVLAGDSTRGVPRPGASAGASDHPRRWAAYSAP